MGKPTQLTYLPSIASSRSTAEGRPSASAERRRPYIIEKTSPLREMTAGIEASTAPAIVVVRLPLGDREMAKAKQAEGAKGDFANVAKIIGAAQLAKPLEQLSTNIEIEVHDVSVVPKTPATDDFQRLRVAARRFQIALDEVSRRLLEFPATADPKALLLARKAASKIAGICNKALNLQRKPGKKRRPGRLTCALIVVEAWIFANGTTPAANDERALKACEAYWLACGGQPSANWQRILKAALQNKSDWRGLIRHEICGMRNGHGDSFTSTVS